MTVIFVSWGSASGPVVKGKVSFVDDSTVAGCPPPTPVPEMNTSAGAVKPLPVKVIVSVCPSAMAPGLTEVMAGPGVVIS